MTNLKSHIGAISVCYLKTTELLYEYNLVKSIKMKVRIPSNIDVDKLLEGLELSMTKFDNLKTRIYYFLSIIATTNENYRLREKDNGYYRISSIKLKKIFGDRLYPKMLKILLNKKNPIIESDNSWQNSHIDKSKNYCIGYALVSKYDTGEFVFKQLDKKFEKKIETFYKNENDDRHQLSENFSFLLKNYSQNEFSFCNEVFEYIRNLAKKLSDRVVDKNPYQFELIYNYVGRLLHYIEMMQPNNIWCKMSIKNHRLNSSFSSLPKIIRPFVKCNNRLLSSVDVSSSQPYILASIIKEKFYNLDIENGFNIKTIYPSLYKQLNQNNMSISNCDYNYYSSYSGNSNNIIYNTNYSSFNNKNNSHSFMWCPFLNNSEMESISKYSSAPFYIDFYTHLIRKYNEINDNKLEGNISDLRKKLKSNMMYVLFDSNSNHRNANEFIRVFKSVYPGVNKWLETMMINIGKKELSYLLQRAESYLLLNIVSRDFSISQPNTPIFTLHDGLFTYEENIKYLDGLLKTRLSEITGVLVGTKVSNSVINPFPDINDVNDVWEKIEPITTEAKFLKKKRAVLKNNITRALDFL